MSKLKRKAVNLLNRFQFIDLAKAVARDPASRKDWLRVYLQRSIVSARFPSYRVFRKAVPTIYGVSRGLDPSPHVGKEELERHVIKACKGVDTDMNVEVALMLFDLVRPEGYSAHDHPPRNLPLGLKRTASIGLETELVRNDELIFQYPYPRRERLNPEISNLMMSMIYHTYSIGDRVGASIEIADLSCPELPTSAPRSPRIIRLSPASLISMDAMAPHIQSVHDLLLEIGDETETSNQ